MNAGTAFPRIIASRFLPAFFVAAVLSLRMGSGSTAVAGYLFLSVYAFLGRKQVIQALVLSWLFTMLNPGLAPDSPALTVARYMVLAAAAVSIALRAASNGRSRINRLTFATLLLSIFLVIHAILFSVMPAISLLKTLSWLLAVGASFLAWSGLNVAQRNQLSAQLFGGLIAIAVLSLPLLMLPVGYLVNGSGFQGILNHPQVFGETMGVLAAWTAGKLLAQRRPRWSLMALLLLCVILIVLSQARTAGLALAIGLLVAGITTARAARRPFRDVLPGLRSSRLLIVIGIAIVGCTLAASTLMPTLRGYISKGTGKTSLLAVYETSRGALIDAMWRNIEEHPVRGIGFGIASNPTSMVVQRDPIFGLPVGAPVEKGVLPLAILEELGIPGVIVVGSWLWLLLLRAARSGGIVAVSVLCTVLLVNLGDSMLFSAGGMGLLLIVLLGWAATGAVADRRGGWIGDERNLVLAKNS